MLDTIKWYLRGEGRGNQLPVRIYSLYLWPINKNIAETIKLTAIVTLKDQSKVVIKKNLENSAICQNLQSFVHI